MIWLNPLALVGLAAIAAPILIHILVQRRAERFAFPTLRFLQPTRLAAIRRHVLEDLPLLIVRAAVLAAAAGALAGPLLITPARRDAWNARTARAIVIDTVGAELAVPPAGADQGRPLREGSFLAQTFESADLRDAIARAIAWLEAAPPAKRELVIVSPFALGSLTRADVDGVSLDVGVRLVRSGPLPASRSFAAAPVLHASEQRGRTIELNGPSTLVRESPGTPATVPIDIVAPPDVTRTAEATLAAVLSQRVLAPVPGRAARVVFAASPPAPAAAASMPAWVAEAIARIGSDPGLQAADSTPSFTASTDGTRLVVTTAMPAADIRTAFLFRSILNALAADRSATTSAEREILSLPDAELRAWERPAGDVSAGPAALRAVDHDDRRWWWGAVLLLLAVETWMRRTRADRENEETQRPQSTQRKSPFAAFARFAFKGDRVA